MSLLSLALSDLYLVLSLLGFVVLYVALDTPLDDGYHLKRVRSPFRWEETYLFFGAALLVYPLTWLAQVLIDLFWTFGSVEFNTFQLTFVLGLLFAGVVGPLWIRTLINSNGRRYYLVRSLGIFLTTTVGIGLGGALAIGIHPSMELVDQLYGYYITVAFGYIEQHQAVLALTLHSLESPLRAIINDYQTHLKPAIQYTFDIYVNNLKITVFGGSIALLGGLAGGLFIPLVMIGGVKIGLILAAYLGLFIRYSIVAGNPLIGPVVAFAAALSLHTIPEIIATVSAETGMGILGMGPTKGWKRGILGAKVAVVGLVGLLGAASFIEVFLSPWVSEPLIGYITIRGEIVPFDHIDTGVYLTGAASTFGTFVVAGMASVFGIRRAVFAMEDWV